MNIFGENLKLIGGENMNVVNASLGIYLVLTLLVIIYNWKQRKQLTDKEKMFLAGMISKYKYVRFIALIFMLFPLLNFQQLWLEPVMTVIVCFSIAVIVEVVYTYFTQRDLKQGEVNPRFRKAYMLMQVPTICLFGLMAIFFSTAR